MGAFGMSKPNKKRTSPKPGVTKPSEEPAEREEQKHGIPAAVRGQGDAREGPLEGDPETEEAVAKARRGPLLRRRRPKSRPPPLPCGNSVRGPPQSLRRTAPPGTENFVLRARNMDPLPPA